MKRFFTIVALLSAFVAAQAQSANFVIGQSLDIQNTILQQLSANYVDTIKFDKLLKTGIDAMLSSLDPYTQYFPEELEEDVEMMTTGMYGGVGSLIKKRPGGGVLITEPYPNTPATKAGLHPGDTIFWIDGKYVYDETADQSSARMKGVAGTNVTFKVIKGGSRDTSTVVVTRERIHRTDLQYAGMIRDSIGYILMTGFTEKVSAEVRDAINDLKAKGAKRLVIDLRGNGGGLLEEAVKIVSLFVPKGTLVVSSKGRGDNTRMNRSSYTADDPIDTEIPLMVMVNSSSASASEIVAGAIQDLDRGVIAGTRTFGKGLVQSIHPTSYNGSVKITTAHYYTPSGRCVQAIDYSRRNADGSVGAIPDSLTHVFYTKKGRPVHDGGGITPDIISEAYAYSRPSASLVYNDILGDYSIKYYIEHKNIDKIEDIALTDADYEDFIAYAKNFDFDYRSGMQTEIENLIKVAKYDGIYEKCREQIEALAKSVDIDKETTLRDKKAEIIPLIEVELAGKYFFQSGAGQVALRDDSQLYNALDKWDTVKL